MAQQLRTEQGWALEVTQEEVKSVLLSLVFTQLLSMIQRILPFCLHALIYQQCTIGTYPVLSPSIIKSMGQSRKYPMHIQNL